MRVDLQQLKNAVSVPSVFEQAGIPANRTKIPCPFCADRPRDRTSPSMFVSAKSYYCFRCKKRGDVISLTMDLLGLSFREALAHLTGDSEKPRPVDPYIKAWDECRILNDRLQDDLDLVEACWAWDRVFESAVTAEALDQYFQDARVRAGFEREIDGLQMAYWNRSWEIKRRANEAR